MKMYKKIIDEIFDHPHIKLIFEFLNDYADNLFIVGGVIRDSFLKGFNINYDIDFAINAPIDIVYKNLLSRQQISNYKLIKIDGGLLNYGVIQISIFNKKYDITMFRTDNYQYGSRYPIVKYVNDINIDYKRRDFTINALYLGYDKCLLDPCEQGILDIEQKKIRFITVDNNTDSEIIRRITEDPLRIIRYIRMYLKIFSDINMNIKDLKNIKDIVKYCNNFLNKIKNYDKETIDIILKNLDLLERVTFNKLILELNKL